MHLALRSFKGARKTERARFKQLAGGERTASPLPAACFSFCYTPQTYTCLMSAQAIRSWHRADDSTPALARSCHQLALTQQRSFICGCCAPQLDIAPFQTGTLSASAVSSRRAPLTTFAPWECQESIAHFKAAWWLVLGPGPTPSRNQRASASA